MKQHRWPLAVLALGLTLAPMAWADEDDQGEAEETEADETSLLLSDLPEPVRGAIERELPGANILSIEEEASGETVYEVDAVAGGEKIDLEIRADGTVAERDVERGDITFEFEVDAPGTLPQGWMAATTNGEGAVGRWEVMQGPEVPSRTHVLGLVDPQHSRGGAFNVLWTDQAQFSDGEVDVYVRARTGVEDQGGGPIWRVQDADNYYICRWNPLENNFRLYVVDAGNRRTLASATTDASAEAWHEIRVIHEGNHIVCWLDDEPLLEADDDTITQAGGVGLWTKADAVSAFDGLTVSTRPRVEDDDDDEGESGAQVGHDEDDDDDEADEGEHDESAEQGEADEDAETPATAPIQ